VFVLTSNTEELQKLPFEDMMPHINESVRRTLVHTRGDKQNLFKDISKDFSKLHISFHIERLKAEFDQSH
jgi:DNA-binding transcriptional regulator GbsR (MarR family)